MAPKTSTKSTTWDDMLKYKFLLEIIARTSPSVSSQVLFDIAEDWGPPQTKASLAMKLHRMKEQYAKQEGIEGATSTSSSAKGNKRKGSEGTDEDGGKKVKKMKKDNRVKSEDDDEH